MIGYIERVLAMIPFMIRFNKSIEEAIILKLDNPHPYSIPGSYVYLKYVSVGNVRQALLLLAKNRLLIFDIDNVAACNIIEP